MNVSSTLEIKSKSGDIKNTTRDLDKLGKQAPKTGKSVDGLTGSLGKMAIGATVLTTATLGMSSAFGNIRQAQKLEGMLKVATGSALGMKVAMSELSQLATIMPVELTDVTNSFIKLKNLGLDSGREAILSYGETASAMGKSLNDFIEAVADAAVGENERLKEFGIKANATGEKVKFTFRGVTTSIEKDASKIERYLIDLGKVNFSGSMAAQMDTIDGKLSNLSDSWFQFTVQLGKTLGAGEIVKNVIDLPISLLDEARFKLVAAGVRMNNASTADIGTIEESIRRKREESKPKLTGIDKLLFDASFGLITSTAMTSSGKSASSASIEELQTKLKALQIEKKITDEKEKQKALNRRKADGIDAITQFGASANKRRLGEREGLELEVSSSVEKADAIMRKLLDGNFRNKSNELAKLEKLDKQFFDATAKLNSLNKKEAEAKKQALNDQAEIRHQEIDQRGEELDRRLDESMQVIDSLRNETEVMRDEYSLRKTILQEAIADEIITEEAGAKALKRLDKEQFTNRLDKAGDFFSGLQELSGGHSKTLFKANKAFALAMAGMNVYSAASSAFATAGGGIFGKTAAAVAASSFELLQLASISQTKFTGNYEHGGVIPGSSYSGDNLIAGVNSGERILTQGDQDTLSKVLSGNMGGRAPKSGYGWSINVNNYGSSRVETEVDEKAKTVSFIIDRAESKISGDIMRKTGRVYTAITTATNAKGASQ